MTTDPSKPVVSLEKSSGGAAQDVVRAVVDSVSSLSSGAGRPGMFPHGLESLGLDVKLSGGDVSSVSLTITGARPGGGGAARVKAAASSAASLKDAITDNVALFNFEGHQVVAVIAMMDLEEHFPGVKQSVEAILAAAADGGRSPEEAAVFPDEIRDEQPQTGRFHFVNIPLRANGPPLPALPSAPHVITKIDDFTRIVRQNTVTAEERADALSWLFHLFGDIHQPMHCVARFSDLHSDGDRGGNSFRLSGSARNLHSLWDNSIDPGGSGSVEAVADDVMGTHTREDLAADLAETNHERWARASFTIAKDFAYTLVENPANPPTPSAAYRRTMKRHGRRQAALAGYRLADHFRALLV